MWRDIYLTAQVLELPARGSRLPTQSYSVLQSHSRPRPPLQDLGADWEVSPFNRALEYVANCSSLSCWNSASLGVEWVQILSFSSDFPIVRPAREAGFRVLRRDTAPVPAERVLCECLCRPSAPSWPAEVRRKLQHAGVARQSRAVLQAGQRSVLYGKTHGVPL